MFNIDRMCKRCGKAFDGFSWEDYCYSCLKERELERIQESIRDEDEDTDTCSTDYVICPHCGNAIETNVSYEDFREIFEEGDHELVCDECGKKYILTTCISYDYETRKV